MEDEINIETVGKYIKSERERHNFTQNDIARITKISPAYIQAIEDDNFLPFPSSYTIKGYIKSIAEAIKADEFYAMKLYESANKNISEIKHEDIVKQKFVEEHQKSIKLKKRLFISAAIIIVIIFGIIGFINIQKAVRTDNISSKLFSIFSAKHKHKLVNKKKSLKSKYIKNKSNIHYKVILKGKVIRKTWVDVSIDDSRQKQSMLYPGTVKIWKAKKNLHIKIGNAGGILLSYNGKYLGKLGKNKEVITLNFPKQK
ncbi:MAG: helix-turn-helix domain-containing protein [Candidatus Acididesulfobacter guangdongensis]|uniref:Helix-turn-helix domain-containing protein n=1 Tax=Acididesulfobacter guangdongensis TaxID=2597225 RepID=A0A519BHN6_ACIG2|nr:MAG: helix-turn-helix domain-containing protein [Candidatus Acididesulfobacter guangdongensis]